MWVHPISIEIDIHDYGIFKSHDKYYYNLTCEDFTNYTIWSLPKNKTSQIYEILNEGKYSNSPDFQ